MSTIIINGFNSELLLTQGFGGIVTPPTPEAPAPAGSGFSHMAPPKRKLAPNVLTAIKLYLTYKLESNNHD